MPNERGEPEVNFREGILVGEHYFENQQEMIKLNNHLHFTVKTHHVAGGDEVRIVGFEVQPYSIAAGYPLDIETLHLQPPQVMKRGYNMTDVSEGIIFSYSWKTVNDETTTWAHRFDQYFEVGKYDVHMKQIFISLGVMLTVACLAASYVRVSITRDFALLAGGDRKSGSHTAVS